MLQRFCSHCTIDVVSATFKQYRTVHVHIQLVYITLMYYYYYYYYYVSYLPNTEQQLGTATWNSNLEQQLGTATWDSILDQLSPVLDNTWTQRVGGTQKILA